MALSVVVQPFGWYPDGFTLENLTPGDERDFGGSTAGLVAAGLVSDEAKPVEAVETADVPPVAETDGELEPLVVADETPVVVSVESVAPEVPPTRKKRK